MRDPGHPLKPEVSEQLIRLNTADPARFETLRSELKTKTPCRVTKLDEMIRRGSQNSEAGGDPESASNMAKRLVTIARAALNGWDDVFLSTQDYQAFADLTVKGRRETWPVDSDYFRHWITTQCFGKTEEVPGAEACLLYTSDAADE